MSSDTDQCSFGCGSFKFKSVDKDGDQLWICPKGHMLIIPKRLAKKEHENSNTRKST